MATDADKRTYLDDRRQKGVRFRPDLIRRIDKVRKVRGWTFQTLVQMAVVKFVETLEGEDKQERKSAAAPSPARTAGGLGIRERLAATQSPVLVDVDDDVPQASPSITVQVQTPTVVAGGDPEIQALAHKVVLAAPHMRRQALEQACAKLSQRTADPEERVRLGELLDQEIKRIEPKPLSTLERVRARRRS